MSIFYSDLSKKSLKGRYYLDSKNGLKKHHYSDAPKWRKEGYSDTLKKLLLLLLLLLLALLLLLNVASFKQYICYITATSCPNNRVSGESHLDPTPLIQRQRTFSDWSIS